MSKIFSVSRGMFRKSQPLLAVNRVDLRIRKGEVVGLVGESGCGKTTLSRMLLGLIPPSEGNIYLNGDSIGNVDRRVLARKIQPIFQDPYSSLNPRKSVPALVGLPLKVHRIGDRAEWRPRVEKMLDLVGLPKRVYHSYPGQLSGGQRQRVAIARALIMRPEVVICDEPTSALDVSVQSQILNLLIDLRESLGLTYLLISHNLAVVEHLATRVAVMYLGRIVEEADTETLFSNPRHPYTRALLDSVLIPDPDLDMPETNLGAAYPNPIDPPSGCSFHPRCAKASPRCTLEAPPIKKDDKGKVACFLYQD